MKKLLSLLIVLVCMSGGLVAHEQKTSEPTVNIVCTVTVPIDVDGNQVPMHLTFQIPVSQKMVNSEFVMNWLGEMLGAGFDVNTESITSSNDDEQDFDDVTFSEEKEEDPLFLKGNDIEVEVNETAECIEVKVDTTFVDPQNVSILFDGLTLIIAHEQQSPGPQDDKHYAMDAKSVRTLSLPDDACTNKAAYSQKDGNIIIKIPRNSECNHEESSEEEVDTDESDENSPGFFFFKFDDEVVEDDEDENSSEW